jgi:hypothetical protein
MRYTLIFIFLIVSQYIKAQNSVIWGPDGFVKIEQGSGGFTADLDPGDRFSRDHDVIGDVNGDGVLDLVVGARSDDDGATDAGAVYILLMHADGTVQSHQKISMLFGGFNEILNAGNFFGYGVAGIGDYDQDGIPDIAVSAPVPPNHSVYVIHLNADGTVKDFVKNSNIIAQGLSCVGDLNNDGRKELADCDPGSDLGGTDVGAIRLLFLTAAGHVIPNQTILIGDQAGGFGSGLSQGDEFGGREVAALGDLDQDGNPELAVGAFMTNGGKGAIWILSLDANSHQVMTKQQIAEGVAGFTDTLTTGSNPNGTAGANFGHAICAAGDLNGDGTIDLLTGANQQNEGWAYILYLNPNKTVHSFTRIHNGEGGFDLSLDPEERFSRSISYFGDLRGDGSVALNVGGGAGGTGALYLLFFKPCHLTVATNNQFWSGSSLLFSNWNSTTQQLTTDSLSFEQCVFAAFQTDASFVNYNTNGACECLGAGAQLSNSQDGMMGFQNLCFSQQGLFNEAPAEEELLYCKIFDPTGRILFDFPAIDAAAMEGLLKTLPNGTYFIQYFMGQEMSCRQYQKIN